MNAIGTVAACLQTFKVVVKVMFRPIKGNHILPILSEDRFLDSVLVHTNQTASFRPKKVGLVVKSRNPQILFFKTRQNCTINNLFVFLFFMSSVFHIIIYCISFYNLKFSITIPNLIIIFMCLFLFEWNPITVQVITISPRLVSLGDTQQPLACGGQSWWNHTIALSRVSKHVNLIMAYRLTILVVVWLDLYTVSALKFVQIIIVLHISVKLPQI